MDRSGAVNRKRYPAMGDFTLADVPEDVSSLSDSALKELQGNVMTLARSMLANDETPGNELSSVRDAHTRVNSEVTARAEARQALSTDLEEADKADVEPEAPKEDPPEEPPKQDPAPAPKAADLAADAPHETPPEPEETQYAALVAAADVPAFSSGTKLTSFKQAAQAVESRLKSYSTPNLRKRGIKLPKGVSAEVINLHKNPVAGRNKFGMSPNATRHGAVRIRREYPEELRITDATANPLSVLDHAADQKRLPGGSLIESVKKSVESGKALTAAVGWCAPSETLLDLCELETLDGILDIAEIQASRGGFQLPMDGGPDFASIWDQIGDEGDVILSEYDIEQGATKQCLEIPCPEFEDVRLDAAYVCLTGGLLQRRGYPEVIQRFSSGAMIALAHKINESVIARIEAASVGPTVIPQLTPSGDDAASALLSAVELAIVDLKYRNRMAFSAVVEVVLPAWFIQPVRAALARRHGVAMLGVSDSMILEWFADRKAVPRFVYDWQDAFSGQEDGPGGATPLTSMPDTMRFLVYPAGTWTKIVQDVINIDTVFDKAQLTANEFTAIFAEDGFNVIQTCPDSRVYEVTMDPSGVVGCCEGGVS